MKNLTFILILIQLIIVLCIFVITAYVGIVDFYSFNPFSKNNDIYYSEKQLKLKNDLPVIDSSIALYPMASVVVQNVYDKKAYSNQLRHVSTSQTFMDLAEGKVDAIIVTMPNHIHKEILNKSGKKIKIVPIAKEALVFFTNKKNSIDSLTIDEIEKIYNDEIKNWNEVGGENKSIKTFQLRKDVGGSEACFATLVENNEIDDTSHFISYDMRNIINSALWNNDSIGYAFNLFYNKLYKKNSLKAIKIDNTLPDYDNITNGKYPLLFDVYYMYDEENTNENIIKILDWILSEEGQDIIEKVGLMPINNKGEI